VSTISVCHSTSAPSLVDETLDALVSLDGVHFGYAQSKCVAETLIRQAAERGIPATILRPSLVTGDTRSGRSNANDLTSRFVAGCIRMAAAPDLDWRMDCVPVDETARSIVRLTLDHEKGLAVSHLTARRPRHWRECVLWMRLAGYEIELIPYRDWLDLLEQTAGRDHPLFPLRAFFSTVVPEEGLTLPELFEESRRRLRRPQCGSRCAPTCFRARSRLDARANERRARGRIVSASRTRRDDSRSRSRAGAE
jgi:thioester reductase-like protein